MSFRVVGCVLMITVYLVVSGIPAIKEIGLVPFLFGKTWESTLSDPSYGILPFILTSILAIMILPSIIKVSITALDAVPKKYEDASPALGAAPVETYFRVSVPAAKSGIATAVVLGIGRAIGEARSVP